jgi:cellulose synthase/poly-beta-1,6-N-acetylglucosamine synthase-like glycosyltransferase
MTWDGFVEGLRSIVTWLMAVTSVPILVYFTIINLSYLVLIVLASIDFRAHRRRRQAEVESFGSALTPGVSVLVPAHNESVGIVTSVQALLSLRYPHHEVVVVDDGSTDDTFARLEAAFDLVPIPRQIPQDVAVLARVIDVHVPRSTSRSTPPPSPS